VTGSNQFSIEPSDNFLRSFKKLAKNNRSDFTGQISGVLEALITDPYPRNCRQEPLPGKLQLPGSWTFHKLDIKCGKGASGQVRLMYVVSEPTLTIRLAWIYSHEQFVKRPTDRDLQRVIEEILEE
jgi:mRNA-degrading endonuclease YafQ of YafQ-DinJ toxin-antitoxin module